MAAMSEAGQDAAGRDWYISGAHARRAVGHLSVALVEEGALPGDFELPRLLDLWGEALTATMSDDDENLSPLDAGDAQGYARLERWHEATLPIIGALAIYGQNVSLPALVEKARALGGMDLLIASQRPPIKPEEPKP
jgi:hypothetical protein